MKRLKLVTTLFSLLFTVAILPIWNSTTPLVNAQLVDEAIADANNNTPVRYVGPFTNTTLNVGGSVLIDFIATPTIVSGYINFTNEPNLQGVLCGAANFSGTRTGNNFQFSFVSNDPEPGCHITHGTVYNVSGTISGNEIINGAFSTPAFNQQGVFNAKQTIRSNGRFFNDNLTLDGNVYVDLATWTNSVAGYINFTGDPDDPALCGANSFTGTRNGNNISFSFLSSDPDAGCDIIDNERFNVTATLSGNSLQNGTYHLPTFGQGGTFSTTGINSPNTPSNVQASDGTHADKVRVTWNAVSGATAYIVYRNTNNSSGGRVQLGVTSSTTYDNFSVQAGQTYYYWVRAVNAIGISGYSSSNSGYSTAPPNTCTVPFYSQRDDRWKNHPLGTGAGNPPLYCSPTCNTIGTCGCTLTAAAMLFKFYRANSITPATLSDCMGNSACPFWWGTGAGCTGGLVSNVEVATFSWNRLQTELNQRKRPVLLELLNGASTHWVLVLSGTGTNPANYIIHDPWPLNGSNNRLSNYSGWSYGSLRMYSGSPGCSYLGGVSAPSLVSGAEPVWSAFDSKKADLNNLLSAHQAMSLSSSSNILGDVTLYSRTATTMTIQLEASGTSGYIQDILVWTDTTPEAGWQPFSFHVYLPASEEIYVRFRDSVGNISAISTDTLYPRIQDSLTNDEIKIYLPIVLQP